MAQKKQIADLHARLTADVRQYDAEMRRASAVTARTQKDVNRSMEQMRKGGTQFGLGLMGAGTAAVLLGNQIKRTVRDIESIPGLDPSVVASINSAKASVGEFDGALKRAIATSVAFAAQAAQNIGLTLGGLIYGFDNVAEAQRRMAEEAANFRPPEEVEQMAKLSTQILEEREKLARFGETRSESLAHEVRLQGELLDQMAALNTESVRFKQLQLERLQAKGRELKLREDITKETEKTANAEAGVSAYSQAIVTMLDNVGDRAAQNFADMVLNGGNAFDQLANIVARSMLEIVARMAIINPLLNMMFGGMNGFTALPSFFGFADGGRPPMGQASMVGERGRELFIPDSPGTIIPAGKTAAIMRGNGGGVVLNQTLHFGAGVSRSELMPMLRQAQRETLAVLQDGRRRGSMAY